MASEVGGEQRCGTGARLRGAREKKGLTVPQAAEKLHVDARTLEALEAEDFAALGAEVYVRGHLRRYAEFIGESPAELQELYTSSTQAARPDLTRISRSEPGDGAARLVLPALLGLVALVVLLWWVLTTPGEKPQPLAGAAPPVPSASATQATAGAADEVTSAAPAGPTPNSEPTSQTWRDDVFGSAVHPTRRNYDYFAELDDRLRSLQPPEVAP